MGQNGERPVRALTETNTTHGEALAMLNSLAAWMDSAKTRTAIPLVKPVPPFSQGYFKGKTEEREQMLSGITETLRRARARYRARQHPDK
ncbi:MAG: hypothetical protein K2G52_06550 [Muribaculaceae bacterium]|nr:hypothetical protein [Muribaculaceae bacterium]